jgi:C-terminal processing protease CtpA/Prc
MSRWETVDPNFAVSVPIAKHLGNDWEGVGIKPDVAVPEAEALNVALELASK